MRNLIMAITAIFLLSGLSGCDGQEGSTRSGTSTNTYNYDKVCIDNVVYLEGAKKFSSWVNPKTMTFSKCKIINGKLVIIKTIKDY